MEHRRHERRRFRGAVTIDWAGAAGQGTSAGDCFDASSYGLLIVAPVSIPAGSTTTVRMHATDQCVEATVRYCRKQGAWYRIGLKLTSVLPLPEA